MKRFVLLFLVAVLPVVPSAGQTADKPPYLNPYLSVDERVNDLLGRMTLQEKVGQMQNEAPAIPHLGIPAYNWWNEALHGVARAGVATVFPQAIGLAATWDTELMYDVATVISEEARAKYHEALRNNQHGIYQGLTFWSPNINIFRDPRWGRGQETYGEDPYLTARLGVSFVQGMQGNNPRYFKTIATPKHFAAHSGPERLRHAFDVPVNERDLRETYLPAFEACVREGKAFSVMCAYNSYAGEPCCSNDYFLTKILRKEWGFTGYVVSDCGAISDIYAGHRTLPSAAEASVAAVRAGCELSCGNEYRALEKAIGNGLITTAEIDEAVRRLFRARFRLGMFDPPEMVPYANIPYSANNRKEHAALALKTTRESIVLLKNEKSLLPLRKDLKRIAVVGPNADEVEVLLGNYNGTPSDPVTPLQGIRNKLGPGTEVIFAKGCSIAEGLGDSAVSGKALLREARKAAQRADAVVLFLGLSPRLEGEEMNVPVKGFSGGDRLTLDLPETQDALLRSIMQLKKPTVLVLLNGSAVAVNRANEHVPAILEVWYPGQEAGTAIADVLFGDYNPGGRLPVTFYRSANQLPPFEDYRMAGRTYRYFSGEPLYPFGHGLSYTNFTYTDLVLESEKIHAGDSLKVSVRVRNAGSREGDEVVQLYLTDEEASAPVPIRSLQGFRRLHLAAGDSATVSFTLSPLQMSLIDRQMRRVIEPGEFTVAAGGKQPDVKGSADARTTGVLKGRFQITGRTILVD